VNEKGTPLKYGGPETKTTTPTYTYAKTKKTINEVLRRKDGVLVAIVFRKLMPEGCDFALQILHMLCHVSDRSGQEVSKDVERVVGICKRISKAPSLLEHVGLLLQRRLLVALVKARV
jgi:hypothetical protein